MILYLFNFTNSLSLDDDHIICNSILSALRGKNYFSQSVDLTLTHNAWEVSVSGLRVEMLNCLLDCGLN